ncbi:MAG: hypothetical protein GYB31_16435 [Bacteroidetes bacterium]|nr:hypothetical protein [Bacteroidota bacterium]
MIIKEISSKNYNNAINYFIDLGNEPIKVTSKRGITFWNITRIAISIISSIKKLEKEETPRVLRLISDIKISSDGNVDFKKTIRILEIAHFISKNKYYMAEHKIKSLNLFIKRNSKNKTYRINKRDIIFSKMLTTIPKADFNRLQLQKSIDLPSKSKIFYSSKFCLELFTPEIIPYEHLWELILETLPNKPYYA